jgi:murein DD-endopeptidase MepM/ murein hydrolase activator NlpD
VASKESALIPSPGQPRDHQWDVGEWDTAEWNVAADWIPGASEQTPPTKGAVDGWDTAEWDMRANWTTPLPSESTGGQWSPAESALTRGPGSFADHPGPACFTDSADAIGSAWSDGSAQTGGSARSDGSARTSGSAWTGGSAWTDGSDEGTDAERWATQLSEGDSSSDTVDTLAPPSRGRHRVAKQRTRARGTAVFGVAAAAVLGVGSVASAQGRSPVSLSLPDLPEVEDMPGIGTIVADVTGSADATSTEAPFEYDAGEALRVRILDQANQQRSAAADTKRDATAVKAAKEAAATKVRVEAAAKKKAAAEAVKRKAAAEAIRLAKSYTKPVSSYTLTAGFGQSSSLWANTHTGQDFAAPTGTPVSAVHGGTITSAGWAGSYGYRIIETLDDGTELWYCHLSSMTVTSGNVTTGETIGRVGATGNVTGPHLHLEVRPDGGGPIDPAPWLRARGLNI